MLTTLVAAETFALHTSSHVPYTSTSYLVLIGTATLAAVLTCVYSLKNSKLHATLARILRGAGAAQLDRNKSTAHLGIQVAERVHQSSEAQAQLLIVIRSLPFAVMLVDDQDKVLVTNQELARLLGRDVPSAQEGPRLVLQELSASFGKSINVLDLIRQARAQQQAIERTVAREALVYRFLFQPVPTEGSQGDTSHMAGTVVLIEDITEAKAIERSREEFFSIASHELRTPLTAIRGNTALIQHYYAGILKDATLRDMVADIHESSVRLIEIVNDFLDASRLEQGRMEFAFTDFDVGSVIERVTYELAAVSREKHIFLRVGENIKSKELPLVHADADRVKQVVYNMVGNAMKFVDKGGVTITAETNSNQLKVNVADTGPGISTESQHLLFHKFQQVGESIITRDTTHGTGLGLYISKLLLERMHGSIKLERSVVGEGSTFSFTLPLANKHRAT